MKTQLGSLENPVRCKDPQGEMDYLDQLAGPNGERIFYRRLGSRPAPEGSPILDIYELTSPDFDYKHTMYMNMYSKGYIEKKAIEGLRLKKSFLRKQPWQEYSFFDEKIAAIYGDPRAELPFKYVYLWSKAGTLLACGPFIYAEFDAFGYPSPEEDTAMIMRMAGEVVQGLKGSSPSNPLHFASRHYLDVFMKTFHFQPAKGEGNELTGKYLYIHIMTKEELAIYAIIESD